MLCGLWTLKQLSETAAFLSKGTIANSVVPSHQVATPALPQLSQSLPALPPLRYNWQGFWQDDSGFPIAYQTWKSEKYLG